MPSGNPTIYKNRKETITPTTTVRLRSLFKDAVGAPVNTDSIPTITIVQPNDVVLLGPTSVGVTRINTGLYEFKHYVELHAVPGIYSDLWAGTINGIPVNGELEFIVSQSDLQRSNADGYIHLGDKPGYNFSQDELVNINRLMDLLRSRLNSSGLHLSIVGGNKQFEQCDIFSAEQLLHFLILSLSIFNQTKFITAFKFDDESICTIFSDILVEGGAVYAMGSKAILEQARQLSVSDNGIQFTPPDVSGTLMAQYTAELSLHKEKVAAIKENFRSSPLGLSAYSSFNGRSPTVLRIAASSLRARQIW